MQNYHNVIIRKAKKDDVNDIVNIIKERCKWLDEKNIEQWNVTRTYGTEYYLKKIKNGSMYVAVLDDRIVGNFMIANNSEFCDYDDNVIYIHHLATDMNYKGLGKTILYKIKELFSEKTIRLDNIGTNDRLNIYYESNGFKRIKTIPAEKYDGKNFGILREHSTK